MSEPTIVCELVSAGSGSKHQRGEWFRPAEGGDIIADSRQCASKAGVTSATQWEETAGHTRL